jgi:uncharacterized membrane protein (DUF106 family)
MSSIFDPVFVPLIRISPLLAVVVLSLLITFIMTIIYKYMTNQKRMKEMKDKLNGFQKEIKAAGKDQKRMMEINKEMMMINAEYMKHSLKPMIVSWIPVLLIFAWMSANLAYYPIHPGEAFNATLKFAPGVSGNVTISSFPQLSIEGSTTKPVENSIAYWALSGNEGSYTLSFSFQNRSYEKKVKISSGTGYENPVTKLAGNITSIEISNRAMKVVKIGNFSMGWFWSYFILALLFNTILRKIMKVY